MKRTDINEPIIKVTRIKDKWHSRLFHDGKIIDEMACENQQDIGWICREMLRWFDKLNGTSLYADASRHRQFFKPNRKRILHGKIWYRGELENNKNRKRQP